MEFTDLSEIDLNYLLPILQTTYDVKVVEEKFGVTIPQWLTIKYRCEACAKETRSRIQTINIRHSAREMICPFCRKISRIFTIHIEKGVNSQLIP